MGSTIGTVQAVQSARKQQIERERTMKGKRPAAAAAAECDTCAGSGIVPGTDRPCPKCVAGREVAVHRAFDRSWRDAVPYRYARYTLSGHPDGRARDIAWQWIAGEEWNRQVGRNLVIAGPVGTGKTGLAIGALHHVHHEGVEVMYLNVPDFLTTMTGLDWKEKGAQMEQYHTVPVLLLDDLGVEQLKEWSMVLLYELIEGRYRDGAPTIITTNYKKAELRERVGDRIVSRIFEGAMVLDLTGEDRRKSKTTRFTDAPGGV